MGHVVNPYLFRLNYTVFWNISVFSKKKFSIFVDLKSLLVYNFFNTFFNTYRNIRRIKLRILKIKISFYCNTVKIFFFFVKHKNMNKNFKKMFNNYEMNYYFFKNIKYTNNFFWLYNYKNKKNLNKICDFKIMDSNSFDIKRNKKIKTLNKILIEHTDIGFKMNNFFLKKKINLLFVKNYKNNFKKNNFRSIKKNFLSFFLKKKLSTRSVFDVLNLNKKLIYKNYEKIIKYFYDFEYLNFKNEQYFNLNNLKLYENYMKNYYSSKLNDIKRFRRKTRKEKKKKFWKKVKMRTFVHKKIHLKVNFKKIKLKEYIYGLRDYFASSNRKRYLHRKFKKLYTYKKTFFFLNINKKRKHNNYFSNIYSNTFFKKKKIRHSINDYSVVLPINKFFYNLCVSKKKQVYINKINNNNKKIYTRYRRRRVKSIFLINDISKKKFNKKSNFSRFYILKKKKKRRRPNLKKILLKEKKMGLLNSVKKRRGFLTLVSTSFKNNLKIIYDKFLLFNFVKKFLKLKMYIYNVFNRIYLYSISSILTICLKKYTRWKFTADFLNDLIIVRLKQKFFIKNIMKFIIKYLNKKVVRNKIKGYAILLKGRFSRKDRAVFEWKKKGKTRKTNKMHIIDFSNKSVNLTYSKAAINIWITRNF